MRIAAGGINTESCTFSPLPTTLVDFVILEANAQFERYPFLDPGEIEPTLHARALPGGVVEAGVYAEIKGRLLEKIRAVLPLDGFLLDIHGAMNVAGMDDAEGDLAAAVREVVGEGCLISASMDLHGNVSAALVERVDLFTAYRTAPHIDVIETRERAYRNLVRCLEEGVRPKRAWVPVPVLLPGERTSTLAEPGISFYASVPDGEAREGVIDCSFWVGYVWADEPRAAAVAVVTGTDEQAIAEEAAKLGQKWWDLRGELNFGVPTGTAIECIDRALAASERPVFISDSGDNPTAGGAGDTTEMLRALVGHSDLRAGGEKAVFASVPDPVAIDACFAAGEGGEVVVSVGGKMDPVHSAPLQISGTVIKLHEGDVTAVRQAVVETGNVKVILTERRKPFHHIADFTQLGIDVQSHKIVSVKIGYLVTELDEAADLALLALTPGAVNQDIPSLTYDRVPRPFFPLNDEFDWEPDIRVY